MYKCCVLLCLLVSVTGCCSQSLPLQVPANISSAHGACNAVKREAKVRSIQGKVDTLLQSTAIPNLLNRPPCHCGGPGEWTRVAYLDMNDPTQQCPSEWRLINSLVRACTQTNSSCNSTFYSTNNILYSHVCGRIIGYQQGTTDAFQGSVDPSIANNLDSAYVDGVSLTHGPPGSRQHIWSFASAVDQEEAGMSSVYPSRICPCINTNINWPYQIPSYVGNSYFCDTGNHGGGLQPSATYSQDPLWDGSGCGPTNTCCTFNSPPWFCTTLPQPTRNNLELRICQAHAHDENTLVNLVEIYVK